MMEENTNPLVSVIMPAYNAGRFLESAIRSVMAQTYPHWELLVLDDGSQDDTVAIAQRLAAEDHRIRVLPNGQNLGVARTRNRGFALCKGAYAALLDSDDLWRAEKLERQLALAEQTGADIIYCSYELIDEQGRKKCEDFLVPESTDFDAMLIRTVISCSTALLSRQIVDRYRFATDVYHEDLALWLQLLRDGFAARGATEVLASYRVMTGTRASNKLKSALNRWRVFRRYLHLPLSKSAVALVRYGFLGLQKYKNKKPDSQGEET